MSKACKLLIEGNIGAGKSTLCKTVVDNSPGGSVVTFPEQVNEEFLKLFYADKRRYAFAFQLHMLESRSNRTKLRIAEAFTDPACEIILLDRSMLGDFVFALTNYITGGISTRELDVYCSMINCAEIEECHRILDSEYGEGEWQFLYLHSDYDDCKWRIDTQRKTCEKDLVDLWYYEVIEQVYFNTLLHLRHRYGERIRVSLESDYFENGTDSVFKLRGKAPPDLDASFFNSGDCGPEFEFLFGTQASVFEIPREVNIERMERVGIEWYGRAVRRSTFAAWAGGHSQ